MSYLDRTQLQDSDEQLLAKQLSMNRKRPPVDLPGYAPQRFLGSGAYGEVWVAVDRNTGRMVAIKFYAHRGGLDWSLLLREVEKLAFLSADRYVVQLLDVGWDADPPYYVMEYVENGSLEDRLKADGPLPPAPAVGIFRDVAVGLLHAHAKGVLHCDLKPANVLLDQDGKPRLADFGQSRLSHEQTPALGTLFYMAPEQADMQAVPDARWDVYALGALLYCMLTGAPPHRNEVTVSEIEGQKDLLGRLKKYREAIYNAPPPAEHRKVKRVDRALADIVNGCLEADPAKRYPNVQSIIDALDERQKRRARRPFIVLGALGPALLLLVMFLLSWGWVNTYFGHFDSELRKRTLENTSYAARHAAQFASAGIVQSFLAVEANAQLPQLHTAIEAVIDDAELGQLVRDLSDPNLDEATLAPLQESYREHPLAKRLSKVLDEIVRRENQPAFSSWLVSDERGLQLARTPEAATVAENWAYRSYFTGRNAEEDQRWRPGPEDRLRKTHLSSVFLSRASDRWTVAISTPIHKRDANGNIRYLGVLAMTVQVGQFMPALNEPHTNSTEHVTVLVDGREGPRRGLIIEHPLYQEFDPQRRPLPARFADYRVPLDELTAGAADNHHANGSLNQNYADPLARDPEGSQFDKVWLAEIAPVVVRNQPTGWYVVVQESYDAAIGDTLGALKHRLSQSGLFALAVIALVIAALWGFVVRPLAQDR